MSITLSAARVLSISGPALDQPGIPPLDAVRLVGHEAINSLFEYRLVVQTPEREPGKAPWQIDEQRLIGQSITVHIELEGQGTYLPGLAGMGRAAGQGAGSREVSGLVAEACVVDADHRHLRVEIVLRPWAHLAQLASDCRSYQDKTLVEVLDTLLKSYPFPVVKRLGGTYGTRDITNAYNETDWNFAERLMQLAGINYHFEHAGGQHSLVLCDDNAGYKPFQPERTEVGDQSPYHRIPVYPPGHRIDREYIHAFRRTSRITPAALETRDHDYTRPLTPLVVRDGQARPAGLGESDRQLLEAYAWRGQGQAPGGGQRGGAWSQPHAGRLGRSPAGASANQTQDYGQKLATRHLQAHLQADGRAEGAGHIRALVPGCSFVLENHVQAHLNEEHLVIATHLDIQAPGQETQSADSDHRPVPSAASPLNGGWRVLTRFTAQPTRTPLRPDPVAPWPTPPSIQVAQVTGPAGSDVHTDDLGRIKLHFLWDRHGRADHTSSCWVRVSQLWAGNQLGGLFVPRVGQLVLVSFEDGDIDRPIVIGTAYHGMNQPPIKLPDNAGVSGLRSREMGSGQGNSAAARSNHILMVDDEGRMQVQLKSDHQHSSLALGVIRRIEDYLGCKDDRGHGAELRTDGHGVLRAALGILISTYRRDAAAGGMKEMQEALLKIDEALRQLEAHAKAAVELGVQEPGDQGDVAQCLRRQRQSLSGSPDALLAELAAPHLAAFSSAGVAICAANDAQITAGDHVAVTSRLHTSFSAGGNLLATAAENIRLFGQKGVRIVASHGDVELQAQNDRLRASAEEQVQIESANDWVEIGAKKGIRLSVGSSCFEVTAEGIRAVTTGLYQSHAAKHLWGGPKSRASHLNDMPTARFDDRYQLVDPAGQALAHRRWTASRADGSTLSGTSDAQGYIDLQRSDVSETLSFEFLDGK